MKTCWEKETANLPAIIMIDEIMSKNTDLIKRLVQICLFSETDENECVLRLKDRELYGIVILMSDVPVRKG